MASRKIFICFFGFLFFIQLKPAYVYSQDTIVTSDNVMILCKVKEVGSKIIRYASLSDSTRLNKIRTSSVSFINYSNGTSDTFYQLQLVPVVLDTSISMYKLGRKYGKLSSHFGYITTSTFLISTLGNLIIAVPFSEHSEPFLLVPAGFLAITIVPPKSYSEFTDKYPYSDPEFRRGFENQRRIEKSKAAIKGFALGLLTDIVFIAVYVSVTR